jgi:hypothetical protein
MLAKGITAIEALVGDDRIESSQTFGDHRGFLCFTHRANEADTLANGCAD